jgi:uncharacterized membrane protein YgcG
MSKLLAVSVALALMACGPALRAQDDSSPQPFSPDQLDNLLASVALYPDPLLAQILLAAAFPDQVDAAARFCRAGAPPADIDGEPWDVSVKAVAHYPTVLYMMADGLDWTTALGQAYANQADDVMASVQRLRQEARSAGNLVSTPQQDIEVDDGNIEIWPAQPQFCYLPIYDPGLAFFGSGGVFGGPVVTFSGGYPIGVWLNSDFDWLHRHIYYHGWSVGGGWIFRSRPYIHLSAVYVNDNLKNAVAKRPAPARPVNYANLTRYNSVHPTATYGNARTNSAVSAANSVPPADNVNNKIIERNTNVDDPRIDLFRGRALVAPPVSRAEPERTAPSESSGAFGGQRSKIDEKASSQRGKSSRASRPAPAPRSSGGGSHAGGGGGSHGGGGGGGSHGGGGGRH